jgi:hypothetical protein
MTRTLIETMSLLMQIGQNPLLWGAPQVGKSASVRAIARSLNAVLITKVAARMAPSDLGFPVVKDGVLHVVPHAWMVKAAQAPRAIVFLDELNNAPDATRSALLTMVNEREVEDFVFPSTVAFIAACNPSEQAVSGSDLTAPETSRWAHLHVTPDLDSWSQAAMADFPDPEGLPVLDSGWRIHVPAARARVLGFLQRQPQSFHVVPDAASFRPESGWPGNRTWKAAWEFLAACESIGASGGVRATGVASLVGDAAAGKYREWEQSSNLADPEEMLRNWQRWNVRGDRSDIVYAELMAMLVRVKERPTPSRLDAAWKLCKRAAENGAMDVAAIAARMLLDLGEMPDEGLVFAPVLRAAGRLGPA